MLSFYQEEIQKLLDAASSLPNSVEPRIIEAWMRTRHGTLDALSAREFRTEVIEAAFCARKATRELNEQLAKSYGL